MKPKVQTVPHQAAWNKGKLVGQKTPLKLKEIWAIRIGLQPTEKVRDLALFNWPSTVSTAAVTCLA